jgi:hypothetical protein
MRTQASGDPEKELLWAFGLEKLIDTGAPSKKPFDLSLLPSDGMND